MQLGNLVTFKTGKLDSNAAVPGGEYPFFTCAKETYQIDKFAFDTECVLLAGNNANGVFSIKYYSGKFNAYQRTYIIEPKNREELSTNFLYYALQLKLRLLQGHSAGTATKYLTLPILNELQIDVPDFGIQNKITSILSAYDDLIENNNRRIALLEESMRLLYREWFVRLRFPGHEHVRVIDGLPERWEKKTLGDVIVLNYGKGLKEAARIDGGIPVYGSSGIVGYHNEALVSGPAIIVGRKGNVGSVYWSAVDCFPIDTVYFITSEQATPFIYLNLQHQHFVSSDVAIPGLNRNHAYAQPILIPSQKLLNQFNEIIDTIIREIEILKTSSTKLSEARDLLLPRLMSGEIDVS